MAICDMNTTESDALQAMVKRLTRIFTSAQLRAVEHVYSHELQAPL